MTRIAPETGDESIVERRRQERYQVSLAGQLIWNDGGHKQPCTITDISLDGGRVDTKDYVVVPACVFLLNEASGDLLECSVRWQAGSEIGLFFIDHGSREARQRLIREHSQGVLDYATKVRESSRKGFVAPALTNARDRSGAGRRRGVWSPLLRLLQRIATAAGNALLRLGGAQAAQSTSKATEER